ncbi:replicative DNA helicase [Spirosoma sordidisoli]|uniref:DNA 5'-3' helicase n=1 Tax=Spirosoma sordidisoli TaxID=2502893 RepID=A0A4Q2UMA9_9BACT|nr:DnaB-like helicase C-terminal domain-containing protein [Spirosoma sordidisoli]RYC70743.1 hypothetical protein EQG79_00895 [Spirosoma sordidisoli]
MFDTLKLPPSDIPSERALLGAIFNEPRRLFDVRAYLDEGNVFYDLELADIYKTMLWVVDAGQTLRPLTVIQRLNMQKKEGIFAKHNLLDLSNEGTGCDVDYTAIHLRELFIKRLAISEASQLIRISFENQPLDHVVAQSQQLTELVTGQVNVGRDRSLDSITSGAFAHIVDASNAPTGLVGVTTGSGRINRLTGGWQKSDLVYMAGRPGSGKSAVALCHADAAASDKTGVGIISLEMSAEDNVMRLISGRCRVPYSELRRGKHADGTPFTPEEWRAIEKARDEINSLPLHFYTKHSYDIADLTYTALDWQQRYGIGLLIVDYVQLLEDRTVKGNDQQRVSAVSRKLKQLNFRTEMPILALAQLSRAVETRKNKRPIMTDLRETGQLEQDGGIIIGLYRDDYYKLQRAKNQRADATLVMPDFDNTIEYDLLKNRNGEVRMAKLWCDIATNRIADDAPGLLPYNGISAPTPSRALAPVQAEDESDVPF